MKKNTAFFVKTLFITSLSLFLFCFFKDDINLKQLLILLERLNNQYPQEKVHLHLDKPYYSIGEDIWFKAYVVDAAENQLTDKSGVLYVDLLDDRDSVRQSLLLPVVNGLARGNIYLSDSLLPAGSYHICAYTKWMENFGSSFFFKKDITIVNALRGVVNGSMKYTSVSSEAGEQIHAAFKFTKDNGDLLEGHPVSYTVKANHEVILSGKTITNSNGQLQLDAVLKNELKDFPIIVNTSLAMGNYKNTNQYFIIKPLATVADVHFFPEGGHLVNGLRTKIAFKALKPDGLSENVTGYITDGGEEHVAEFRSEHAGMGFFGLLPVAGKKYTAVITHEDGSEKRYVLPIAEPRGYVMNINHAGADSLSVKIAATSNFIDGREGILIAQCNGIVQFTAKVKLDKSSQLSYIFSKKFRTGITQFTLFNPDNLPVAERLIYIEHNNGLTAEIQAEKATYAHHGKVDLNLQVKDANNNPVVGSFSVAIIDEGKINLLEDEEQTIFSNLLLTSDIKGYIEKPNYYFNASNTDRLRHLDQLLLTQGWRRFDWTSLQANKFPVIKYQREQSLTITGTVTTLGNKPIPNGRVTLLATTKNGVIILDTIADETGRYVFDKLDFPDSAKIVVRASNAKNSGLVKTTIDKTPLINYPPFMTQRYTVTQSELNRYVTSTRARFDELSKLGQMKNVTALREVNIKAKKDLFAATTVTNSAIMTPGSADFVIKENKLREETNLPNVLFHVPGVVILDNKAYLFKNIHIAPMLVLVNGARYDASFIKDIPIQDIAGVEILKSVSNIMMYSGEGSAGVLIITMKPGGHIPINNSYNVEHAAPKGYSVVKQFYSPAYDTPNEMTKMTDLRSTIYWNPDLVTDAAGKATINYFNADGTGTYKVTIEGMDTQGHLLRKIFTYAVK